MYLTVGAVIKAGEQIARTILHTFLGVEFGQAGTDLAIATIGQSSPETAKNTKIVQQE